MMMVGEAWLCRGVGRAFGGSENFELAFDHAFAVGADPSQCVVFLGGAHVDQRALRPLGCWFVWFCGIDDGRQVFDFLFEGWVGRDCVFPDLVGIGGKVDVGFVGAVEDAGFFVVEVENGSLVFVFEECFVRADHFGIVAKAQSRAGTPFTSLIATKLKA